MNENTSKPTVAVFDFDGTLTYRDSLVYFLFFTSGFLKTVFKLFILSPFLISYFLGSSSRQKTKERVLTKFFKEKSIEEIRRKGEEFAITRLNSLLRPDMFQRLKWHQEQGHRCVLVSANLDIYLEPWAFHNGFQDVITSRLEEIDGKVTGCLIGKNCWGPEKARRLQELLGSTKDYYLYVYGDSRGDHEMLALADNPFLVSLKR